MKQFDVLIIGAGAVGNAIAREITKKNRASVGVLEKEPDTAFGASGRNSGVLHAGFNNKPGSFMAKLCVQGSEGFEKEAAELGIEFRRTGKLVVARFEEDLERLQKLKEQGEANGVRELRVIGREELEKRAGYEAGVGALWSGMTGIFDPFLYTVALAEAAAAQGTEFCFGRQVTGIEPYKPADAALTDRRAKQADFLVTALNLVTGQEEHYQTGVLINSAGLFADEICRMVGIDDYRIYPCRGEYHILSKGEHRSLLDKMGSAEGKPPLPAKEGAQAAGSRRREPSGSLAEVAQPLILDKKQLKLLALPLYPIPNEKEGGLGVHLTPTIHGNILIGPSAEYLTEEQERDEYSTTRDVMDKLTEEGTGLFPGLERKDCIRSFAGIRPKLVSEAEGGYADFVIGESGKVPGFIQLVGIESPGLTASIPIGKMVAQMAFEILLRNISINGGAGNKDINNIGAGNIGASVAGLEPGDQKMLCRCEGITEAAVLEAYGRILKIGAIPSVKGLKNRTRVTMGNCQGSFCTVNIIELLQKKRNVDPLTLLWNGFGSLMFEGKVRE